MNRSKKRVEEKWRGRPTHELREQVAIRVALTELPREEIAKGIGCDLETLELHFSDQLERASAKAFLRRDVKRIISKSAREGNAKSASLLYKLKYGRPLDGRGRWKRPRNRTKPVLGKKAQQQLEAERMSKSDPIYAPAAPPKLKLIKSDDDE